MHAVEQAASVIGGALRGDARSAAALPAAASTVVQAEPPSNMGESCCVRWFRRGLARPRVCFDHIVLNRLAMRFALVPRCTADPDSWLDRVHDAYPSIVPSHYALVNGIEPYERCVSGSACRHS